MNNQIIKEQFNKYAEKYENWSSKQGENQFDNYINCCKIQSSDNLLDVACGPGNFALYVAQKVNDVTGIDISDKAIEISNRYALERELSNTKFICSDVENIPLPDNTFAVVVSRYAFHHFNKAEVVLNEMVRCCQVGGKISVLDIVAYQNDYVFSFFEKLDKLIDISHCKTLSKLEFNQLLNNAGIKKINEFVMDVDLNILEYMNQAVLDYENEKKIKNLIENGLEDEKLSYFLFKKDGELYFKRQIYFMLGEKE